MAARRKIRRDAQLAFEALSIEGGLLPPDWLGRIAQLAADAQTEADYRVPKGLVLRDEIGRFWRIAQAHYRDYATGRAANADPAKLSERFVLGLLRDVFGFGSLLPAAPSEFGGRAYPVRFRALGVRVPVVIAPAGFGLDTTSPAFGDVGRRRSAFGLCQELLNADDDALWGLAIDGDRLRVLRDNGSLTRPAWIEADLARIFAEERYADFAPLWLLIHESRFGAADKPPSECPLETWRSKAREAGTEARERLRYGVQDALEGLGQGFLGHPDNTALRKALEDGSLSKASYFQQLLRLVYRLLFLLTAEEREVLHAPDAADDAKARYAAGYGVRRLRDRAVRRSAHDRFGDLWQGLQIVLRALARGEPKLGLPALGGLFASDHTPALDGAKLSNAALLTALFRLAWLKDDGALERVNWRDMGPEELGSVYESLLELVPQITEDGRKFAFATGSETRGNARKTTGSYYTPDSLVQVLLDSALEPIVADTIARNPENPVEALLGLSIVDPACGSGHFLLAAARRLAVHVARLQSPGMPSAGEYRHALRQVVGRCVFGVDLIPMAVELCKVSLWMEAVEPGLPLTFLNSHIQHGNALLGTTPELMAKGIPDAAWEPIEGDDKKVASALKKRNKTSAAGQRSLDALWASPAEAESKAVARAVADLEAASDANLDGVTRKENQWSGILDSTEYRHQKFVADAWCAAFVWPKQAGPEAESAPTNELWRQLRDGQGQPSAVTTTTVSELAEQYSFFHWHLQFPQVFAKGGFDIVLGNPPWEHVELKEEEWFAQRLPEIATARNAATRKRMIASLQSTAPALHAQFVAALRSIEGANHLSRESGRYPLCARGRINTYALFSEHNRAVIRRHGRAGFIVPTGIATDDNTKDYFGLLVAQRELKRFYSFENEEFVFPGVHHAFRFALLTFGRAQDPTPADLVFFARSVAALADRDRHFSLTPEEFELLNPNTRTCPTFRSRRDAALNIEVYRRTGVLWREGEADGNPWGLRFMQGVFNMASDSSLFRTRAELEAAGWKRDGNQYVLDKQRVLPLVEAKMIHQFDHRFGTYEEQTDAQANQGKLPEFGDADHADPRKLTLPKYWVAEREVAARLDERWQRGWLLGWRDICRSTDQRTVIASLIPRAGSGDTFLLAMPSVDPRAVACLYSNLCSFALDYAARQKVGGTHLKYHTFKQLPVLAPSTYSRETPWLPGTPLREWFIPRILELTYTAWDLSPFARDVGYDGPPLRWDPERRFLLRCELDAAFFHLYELKREDVDYILGTFPVVKKNDERAHNEYRTKRVILETYDALGGASRSRSRYRSPLFDREATT